MRSTWYFFLSLIFHLDKQMYLGKTHYICRAFALTARQRHSYLLTDLKQATPDHGNLINCDEYADRFTLFVFDLTPDLDDSGHFHLVKQGNLRLELHFINTLSKSINMLVYAEFDNVL